MLKRLIFLLVMGFSTAALADDADIEATIANQIEAFESNDFERAFEFASPMILGLFGTAENFGAMVKGGYPMVWRPSEVSFLNLRQISGRLFQKVQVQGPGGAFYELDYEMVQIDGVWRINGVQILPGRQHGA